MKTPSNPMFLSPPAGTMKAKPLPLPVPFALKCLVLGVLWALLGWSEAGAQTKIYHADGNYQGSLRYVVDGDRIYYADGNYRGKLAAVVDGGVPRALLFVLLNH